MAKKTKRSPTTRTPAPPQKQERPRVPSFARLDAVLEQRALWVFLAVLAVAEFAVFKDFLLLRNVYLYKDIGSDSINSMYPSLFHTVEYIRSDGVPKWSFNQGMGQSLFGLLTFDPFLAVFYLAGTAGLAYAIVYVEVLKSVLGGVFFFLFLRALPVSGYAALVGALLYAFTGYMILGGGWYIFSYDAMCIALLLYATERFFKTGSWYLIPLPVALMAAYQPFHLYLYGILLSVYAIVRSFEEKPWDVRYAFSSVLRLVPFAVLGAGLAGVFFFSNVAQILDSPRVGGESSYFQILSSQPVFQLAPPIQYVSEAMRLFSSDLLGTGNSFTGWGNYLESPLLYAGLVTLLLVPQIFVFAEPRRRILYAALLGVCLIPLILPYARYAFWLFAGDYFRALTFFVSITLLYLGVRALDAVVREGKVGSITLASSLLVALVVLYLPAAYEQYADVNQGLRLGITLLIVAEALLLFALAAERYRPLVKAGIVAIVAFEVGYLSSITVNDRDILSSAELTQRSGYNDYTNEAVAYVDSIDDGFHRVVKDYASGPAMHASLNDAKIQRYKGTTSYHPFNQRYYIEFLQTVGVIGIGNEVQTRWAPGLGDRLPLEAMGSVRYRLTRRTEPDVLGPTYEYLADRNDIRIYRNRYALPLGFAYDRYLPASAFNALTPARKDQAIIKAVVVNDAELERVGALAEFDPARLGDDYLLGDYELDIAARRADTLSVTEHSQNRIAGTVTFERDSFLFFSIPFDRGWSATVDGESVPLLHANVGFMGLMLGAGTHQVSLEFEPPYLAAGAGVSVVSMLVFVLLALHSRRRGGSAQAS